MVQVADEHILKFVLEIFLLHEIGYLDQGIDHAKICMLLVVISRLP